MKNFFLVINKDKIYAYVVSILTIVVIFFMSNMLGSDLKDAQETGTNTVENYVESNENQETETTSTITEENVTEVEDGEIGEAISTDAPSESEEESDEIGEEASTNTNNE